MTFEEWFMKGINIDVNFEGPFDFKTCSRYFDTKLSRSAWDYQQKRLDEAIKVIEFYADENNWDEVEVGVSPYNICVQTILYDTEFLEGKGEKGGQLAREFLSNHKQK